MPRLFPRPVEAAVRVLKTICDDPQNPTAQRARAAELLLAAYGYANLRPDEEPRQRTVKQVAAARVNISALDKQLTGKIAEDRKAKKLERAMDKLLTSTAKETND